MNNTTEEKADRDTLIRQLMPLKEFYKLCDYVAINGTVLQVLPYLLARYGVEGRQLSHMANLKYGDIDRHKRVIRIKQRDLIDECKVLNLPIDDNFIERLDLWVPSWDSINNKDNYVLGLNRKRLPKTRNTIGSAMWRFVKVAGINSIAINDLVRTRQLELLLCVRKTRRLSSKDFKNMLSKFKSGDISSTGKQSLIRTYECLTRDKVVRNKCSGDECSIPFEERLRDDSAYETASKIIKDLNLKIDWRTKDV